MESLELYYNKSLIRNLLKENSNITWVGLPLEEINMDFYLEGENINLYQEIILRLYKCGYGDKKNIEDILKFKGISESEETENLLDYILKELETLNYIKDNEITLQGEEALSNIDILGNQNKEIGSIFYNIISQEYMNYIKKTNTLFEENPLEKQKILKTDIHQKINFGTPGEPRELRIKFLEKNIPSQINNFNIEDFIKIITEELRILKQIQEESIYIKENIKEKREFLQGLRKFFKKDSKLVYILIAIKPNGEVINSFYPEMIDNSLKADLEKIPEIKAKFKENIDVLYDIGKKEKNKVEKNISEKEKSIIIESGGKLQEHLELVRNLSILFISEENNLDKDQFSKYKENIPIIYNCFTEGFRYLLHKYIKTNSYKREKNIELAVKNILKINYNLEEELVQFYTTKLNSNMSDFILRSSKLIDIFIYTIFLENKCDENKLENYLINNPSFFTFIKKLICERNRFSHSGEDQEYQDEQLEFDFESEGKAKLIDFIENIFEFKFDISLNSKGLDENLKNQIKNQSKKEIELEFNEVDIFSVFQELASSKEYFKYYEYFNNKIYKAQFIKSVGILLESIMKLLRERMGGKQLNLLEELNRKDLEIIRISEVEEKFLKHSKNYTLLDILFERVKDKVGVQKKKIIQTSFSFNKGTLNTYALALLYTEENSIIKYIKDKYPEFFKIVFVVSDLRSHNGDFNISITEEAKDEVINVKKFLEETYLIIKDILKSMGV